MNPVSLTFVFVFLSIFVPTHSAHAWQTSDQAASNLTKRFRSEKNNLWADGNTATLFYQGPATNVTAYFGGSRQPMKRVAKSNVWIATRDFKDLSKGIINYTLQIQFAGKNRSKLQKGNWRGIEAPSAIKFGTVLQGKISQHQVESVYLEQKTRTVTVYQPPVKFLTKSAAVIYMADGSGVDEFAKAIEPMILDGQIRPIHIVGVHSGGYLGQLKSDFSNYDQSQDLRAAEYLPKIQSKHFDLHRKYFCDEIATWAERKFFISTKTADRGIMGVSNGGRFAATIGSEKEARFGHVFAFSIGDGMEMNQEIAPLKQVSFYLAAGTWEQRFHGNTTCFHEMLKANGIESQLEIRTAAHDRTMWLEEFSKAVQKAFPAIKP